jgi:hypothetical protein
MIPSQESMPPNTLNRSAASRRGARLAYALDAY